MKLSRFLTQSFAPNLAQCTMHSALQWVESKAKSQKMSKLKKLQEITKIQNKIQIKFGLFKGYSTHCAICAKPQYITDLELCESVQTCAASKTILKKVYLRCIYFHYVIHKDSVDCFWFWLTWLAPYNHMHFEICLPCKMMGVVLVSHFSNEMPITKVVSG
jgi:hypothetical protein